MPGPNARHEDTVAPAAGSGRALGTIALVALALLMLSGLGYLFWKNVLAERFAANGSGVAPPVLATGPGTKDSGPGISPTPLADGTDLGSAAKKDATAPKKADEKPMPDGDDGDVADVKKPGPPPPPLVEQNTKPDPEPKQKLPPPSPEVLVPAAQSGAAGVDAKRVDAAVAKGVQYLKERQKADGSWDGMFMVGCTSLAALTLLECQVPATDPAVQKAAQCVRSNMGELEKTYEIAGTLLFLERLGDPRDRVLIQGLALRLLAGQNDSGGWGYHCPLLNLADTRQLHVYLQSHRPASTAKEGKAKGATDLSDNPLPQWAGLLQARAGFGKEVTPPMMGDLMAVPLPPAKDTRNPAAGPFRPAGSKAPADPNKGGKKAQPIHPSQLPPHLQNLPVVLLSWNKGWMTAKNGGGDNSNTQFALLALWAARRHDIASEYPLLLSFQRFERIQANDGGWGYTVGKQSSNTMTCVGLLGLAMGYGVLPNSGGADKLENAAIQNALDALGSQIGSPSSDAAAKPPMQNMYFLWSVERVAMLYNLKTIGGRDWYGWGAQILLANQHAGGHWFGGPGQYTGTTEHIDTCFALLFLKRSNLVSDLTESLRLNMVIRDPGTK